MYSSKEIVENNRNVTLVDLMITKLSVKTSISVVRSKPPTVLFEDETP